MKTMCEVVETLDGALKHLFEAVRDQLLAFGADTEEKCCRNYLAFKRRRGFSTRNFACVKVRPTKQVVRVYLKRDDLPDDLALERGFSRDAIGGTGDFELSLRTPEDLERATYLLRMSYTAS